MTVGGHEVSRESVSGCGSGGEHAGTVDYDFKPKEVYEVAGWVAVWTRALRGVAIRSRDGGSDCRLSGRHRG